MGKKVLVRVVECLALIAILPLIVIARLGIWMGSDSCFTGLAQALSVVPGNSGILLRRVFYRSTLSKCKGLLIVGFGSYFSKSRALVGKSVYIGAYCILGLTEIR